MISISIEKALTKATNHYTYQMSPKFLVNVNLCVQPPDYTTLFAWQQYPNAEMAQDIQMLWYDWCETHTLMTQSDWCKIHTLMLKSDWCEIHTQMQRSDWCEQHTTLHADIELSFLLIKKINSKLQTRFFSWNLWTFLVSLND